VIIVQPRWREKNTEMPTLLMITDGMGREGWTGMDWAGDGMGMREAALGV
jgi:hypothetical protein